MITALIPAHNEQAHIAETVRSLQAQTRVPDRIVVISDNSTDATVAEALASGAEVIESVGNTHKKAGALNQVLAAMLQPAPGPNDFFLVMDADTSLSPEFVAVAEQRLLDDAGVAAIGAVFEADRSDGLLPLLQSNEWARYGHEIKRTGKVFVLSGTASLIRGRVLRQVAYSRGVRLPGVPGDVYDVVALTEDGELTLAIKTLGWRLESPAECRSISEVMARWPDLWRQRLRWYRGAFENVRSYGVTRLTLPYWKQHVMLCFGVLCIWAYIALTIASIVIGQRFELTWFGAALTAAFMVERLVTVWSAGWRARGIAALLYVELLYEMFLQAAYVTAAIQSLAKREAVWYHPTDRDLVPASA